MSETPTEIELDLRRLLSVAENTPPVDSIDVVAEELRRAVGGRSVSLLITNFSGSGLERLSYIAAVDEASDGHNERTSPVALSGSVHETVMRRQEPEVVATAGARRHRRQPPRRRHRPVHRLARPDQGTRRLPRRRSLGVTLVELRRQLAVAAAAARRSAFTAS